MDKYRVNWAYGNIYILNEDKDGYIFLCRFLPFDFDSEKEVIDWIETYRIGSKM